MKFCNKKVGFKIFVKFVGDKFTDLNFIISAFIVFSFLMLMTFMLLFVYYGYYSGAFHHSFCIKEECVNNFMVVYKIPLTYLTYFSKAIASCVGVFAIFTALHTYRESVKSNHLSTHLSHYKNFQKYVIYLMESLPTITKEFVDIYFLYDYIFPKSKEGKYYASKQYEDFIRDLNNIIEEYNEQRSGKTDVIQPFNKHQRKIKDLFKKLNICFPLKPNQSDFHKVEFDVYELLEKINQAFLDDEFLKIEEVRYS